jgi:hypothetical protein
MKWDSTAQGLGLLILSVGLTVAIYFVFFFQITENEYIETQCNIKMVKIVENDDDLSTSEHIAHLYVSNDWNYLWKLEGLFEYYA